MKKTLKISGIVVFALIILFTIIGSFIAIQSRPISAQNTAHISQITGDLPSLKRRVNSNTNQISNLTNSVNSNTNQISNLTNSVNTNTNQISNLTNSVNTNTNQIHKLSESHDKLQKITWAHGAKVNCVVKAVFETAYGKSS
jgi:methyl-accepting chemotaxis protein